MRIARKVLALLTARERKYLYLLAALSVVTGLLQLVGIASIMPFLSVVSDPVGALDNEWMRRVYDLIGFEDTNAFLIFLGVMVLVALAISNGATALTAWFTLRYSWLLGHHLSRRALEDYIYRPYDFFLDRNTAELGSKILSEIWEVVNSIVLPGIRMLSNGITAIFILGLLLVVDPLLATVAAIVLGGMYLGIYVLVRRKLIQLGNDRVGANQARYQAVSEAFGGIKDVKILGREASYLARFTIPSRKYALSKSASQVIKNIPSYALELIAFGGIVLIVLYLLAAGGSVSSVLPLIGLYAFASYRLKPALQSVFSSVTEIRSGVASLDSLNRDIQVPRTSLGTDRRKVDPLPLERSLRICDLSFGYIDNGKPLFKGLDLEIRANTSVAFVGETGSGKTTLVDLLMGLLTPHEGWLEVDGKKLEGDRLLGWQNNIGYVPQSIYLSDVSVARNIAFGVPEDEVDVDLVERAAKMANIHEFIVGELAGGYDTVVGERGIRLSGGQRQRIGIARALYHDPDILILDEATSALDGVTEQSVFSAVENVREKKTIIMIAHRLTTVRDCDVIYLLEHGEIIAQGTYDELLESSETFRKMALGVDAKHEAPSDARSVRAG